MNRMMVLGRNLVFGYLDPWGNSKHPIFLGTLVSTTIEKVWLYLGLQVEWGLGVTTLLLGSRRFGTTAQDAHLARPSADHKSFKEVVLMECIVRCIYIYIEYNGIE